MIAEKMVCIDIEGPDDARKSELNNAPIVSGDAPAARLPAIHPLSAVSVLVRNEDAPAGLYQIFLPGEELIVREQRGAADACGRGAVRESAAGGDV